MNDSATMATAVIETSKGTINLVLFPEEIHVRRSLAKRLRNAGFTVTFDHAFEAVITACATTRAAAEGTWITPAMHAAYCRLHIEGDAHSVGR